MFPFLLHASEGGGKSVKVGEYLGAIPSEIPDWFKESFLDLSDDVSEAAAQNKRLMIYFHQPGCPYCAKLVDENFTDPKIKAYVQKHFDGITINMWGDRDVVSIGNKDFTEKEFALALKVHYTPTILFLNEQGKVALRLNGYYPPDKFQTALRFVAEHAETKMSFNQYVTLNAIKTAENSQHSIIKEDFYNETDDIQSLMKNSNRATAVYFERANCADCTDMHEKILTDKATRDIVMQLNNVQLDANSQALITIPSGQRLKISDWADQLNIGYYPSVVFFDAKGEEVMRIAGFLKTFHFQSVYDYVKEKAYLTEPSFQRYIAERGERIRDAGFNTDIWGYKSEYELKNISK